MTGGRAERQRLEARRVIAGRGAELLERKQRIMTDELERLHLHADNIRAEWQRAAGEAEHWGRRAAALDGVLAIEQRSPALPAELEVEWATAMGVRFPADAHCRLPAPSRMGGSAALPLAAAAYRTALEAAARCAAVERAVTLLSNEIDATRTRRRAVADHVIPRLDGQLQAIRRVLDDQELEESLRLRWSADVVRTGRSAQRQEKR